MELQDRLCSEVDSLWMELYGVLCSEVDSVRTESYGRICSEVDSVWMELSCRFCSEVDPDGLPTGPGTLHYPEQGTFQGLFSHGVDNRDDRLSLEIRYS
jgi:hypothetical protein